VRSRAIIALLFYFTGVILICLALCADGLIGNYQEKALKQHSAGNSEMVGILVSLTFYILFEIHSRHQKWKQI